MDIRKHALVPTTTIHLRDGSDNPIYADEAKEKPVTIRVYGPGTKQFAAAEARNQRKMTEAFGTRRGRKDLDQASLRVDFLVAITIGSENLEYDGKEGEELYRGIYSDPELRFIPDQVYEFVNETGNFTKSSPTS